MPRDMYRIAMVSPYPPPRAKHVYGSGVSSYTKNLVEALQSTYPKLEIHVVAERREGLPKLYLDKSIVVHRVYDRGPLYVFQIFRELCRIRPGITHIQHEYFLYGGVITAILFPLLVLFSRLISSKVIVTIHGVIPLRLLDDKEFRKENGIKGIPIILKIGMLLITKLIAFFTNKIVVHEEFLKKYLINDYRVKARKIVVIPHGVEDLKPLPMEKAKRALGLSGKIVLLYFGYLTGYKGLKELLDAYREIVTRIPNAILIIAGGLHPRLVKEKWYRDWVHSLFKKAQIVQKEVGDSNRILFTGYVLEDNIPLYFSAADVVILPYKVRIAASGSEALAISFEKPYIVVPTRIDNSYVLAREIVMKIKNELKKLKKRSESLKRLRDWFYIATIHLSIYQRLSRH